MESLGKAVQAEIKRQGKTQNEIAKEVGISANSLSQICIDKKFPHKNTLDKLCRALNIRISFLPSIKQKIKIEGVHFEYLPTTPSERKIKDDPCLLSIEYRDECAWLNDKDIVILRDFLNQLPLTNV